MDDIELRGVAVRFGRRDHWVLDDVSGVLPAGSVTAVTGRNGAGKTTLLRVLAGVLPATRGTVVGRPDVVGWVPERFPADQVWTVRQYLTRSARARGVRPEGIEGWTDRLYLTPFLDTRLAELSKGTAQKVGLIQALIAGPGLLVLDEPWEGLDAATRTELPALVAEVTAAGGVCVVSDHRGEIAGLRADAEWHLDRGRLTDAEPRGGRQIVEILVDGEDLAETMKALQAAGHRIRAVRPEEHETAPQ